MRTLVLSLLLVPALLSAGVIDTMWTRHYTGTTQTQYNQAADVLYDTLRKLVFVAGSGEDEWNGTDMLLQVYKDDGTFIDSKAIGGRYTGYDMSHAMVLDDSGYVYVVGTTWEATDRWYDMVWAKFKLQPTMSGGDTLYRVWTEKSANLRDDQAFDVCLGPNNSLYICGTKDSTLGTYSLSSFFVRRVARYNGQITWDREYLLDTLAFGMPRKRRDMHPEFWDFADWELLDNSATALAPTSDGGVVATGFGLSSDYLLEWWTMKFDSSGNQTWQVTRHNDSCGPQELDNDDVAFDVAVATNGDVYVCGFDYYSRGSSDQFFNYSVARYNSSGSMQAWNSLDAGVEGDDYAFSLCLDDSSTQNVYVTGTMDLGTNGEQIVTHKFNSSLTPLWGTTGAVFGGTGDDRGYNVKYNRGRVYVAGRYGQTSDDVAALCYTAANSSSKDTLWTWFHDHAGYEDFGAAIFATDSDHVFLAGQCGHTGIGSPWSELYLARLFHRWPDVAAVQIIAPVDTVNYGDSIIPVARVRNVGNTYATFKTHLFIDGTWRDSLNHIGVAPGVTIYDSFPRKWFASPSGSMQPESCIVVMAGDTNLSNNRARDTVWVMGADVGATQILSPPDTVDVGASVTPRAVVRNYRSWAVTFPVRFYIGGVYTRDTAILLAGSQIDTIDFATWTPATVGAFTAKCTTRLTGDATPSNDMASKPVYVRGPDVGATAILSPPDSVDLGVAVTPRAVLRNYRPVAVTTPVRFYIGAAYTRDTIVNLAANQIDTIDFFDWMPATVGAFTAKCTTRLTGDVVPSNNLATKSVYVRGPDVGATAILAPSGAVTYGSVIAPRAVVRNYRALTQNVPVRFTIGSLYLDDTTVALPGNTIDTIDFADWTADQYGTFTTKCSTRLATDVNPANNAVTGTVSVGRHDVGCSLLVAPVGVVDSGVSVTPQAWLRNYGSSAEIFSCRLAIGGWYADTQNVGLAPGATLLRTFAPLVVRARGTWAVVCSTMLTGDEMNGNDIRADSLTVLVTDMELAQILSLPDTVDTGAVVTPSARVVNHGTTAASSWVRFMMEYGAFVQLPGPGFQAPGTEPQGLNPTRQAPGGASQTVPLLSGSAPGGGTDSIGYLDSVWVSLSPLAETTVTFSSSGRMMRFGTWRATAWCGITRDQHPQNDTAKRTIWVRPPGGISWPYGWHEVTSIPLGLSAKGVKAGSSVAAMEGTDPPLIYATKGYKTSEFYSFNYLTETWHTLPWVPLGREAKPPYTGSGICTDNNGSVYLIKGNNTVGFYRYTVSDSTWTQLRDVPFGVSGKKVKNGADIVFVEKRDSGFVYLLKGYRNEFYRYDIARDSWLTMPNAPTGVNLKWDKGSFLVHDAAQTIYAHKAKYNELWKYDLSRDSWVGQLAGMPMYNMMGRRKKAKDGSAGAWFDAGFYAFKGGNTQEYWRYNALTDTWTEKETIPAYGSSGRKKKVKDGGDLTYTSYACWALKGNKTREFWRYGIPIADGDATLALGVHDGALAFDVGPKAYGLWRVVPNPLTGDGLLEYSLSGRAILTARMYDATGRLAAVPLSGREVSGHGHLRFETAGLAAGVYLLRLDTGPAGSVTSLKVVVR